MAGLTDSQRLNLIKADEDHRIGKNAELGAMMLYLLVSNIALFLVIYVMLNAHVAIFIVCVFANAALAIRNAYKSIDQRDRVYRKFLGVSQ